MSYNRTLQAYIEEYYRTNGKKATPLDIYEIVDWLLAKRVWEPSRKDARNILARELSQAMRTKVILDDNGNKVRRMHCVRKKVDQGDGTLKQMAFWHDMEFAPPPFMQESIQQRRGDIANDCWAITKDVEYYNKNFNKAQPIEVWLDFREDMEERKMTGGTDPDDEE